MDKSLLVRRENHDGNSRYFLLETMREYALEKLKAHGEVDLWMERLGWYLIVMAEVATIPLFDDAPNMQFALSWAQSAPAASELEMMLAGAYGFYTHLSNSEEIDWVSSTLQRRRFHDMPEARMNALFNMGGYYKVTGEHQRARVYYEGALALARELGLQILIARIADQAGHNARERGDVLAARALLQEARQITWAVDPLSIPFMLTTHAEVEVVAENADEAQRLLEESEGYLAQWAEIDSLTKTANHCWNLNHLGHVAALRGQHQIARALYEESIASFQQFPYFYPLSWGKMWCYQNMSESSLALGDIAQARLDVLASVAIFSQFSDKMVLSWCLATLAGVYTLDEEPERGAKLWGASEALRERIGCRIAPASRLNRERTVKLLHEQLGEAEFARLTAEGAKMSVDEAVAFAQDVGA
jgi:tetratricopeptide (TPR) repeat protein